MKVIKSHEGTTYDAKLHYNMWGVRKFGKPEGSNGLTVSVSEFLPNGGADMSDAPIERIYYVLRGSITVENGTTGEKFVINENDMIYIGPGEKRSMTVNGNIAAQVMVMIA
jgi:mannose-6-phosphate isomerase-like protein (cupin superfamily)